jgi:hypothetical protein
VSFGVPAGAAVRAAKANEIDGRNRLTAPVWGDRLDVEQYLERERILRATTFAKRAMRTWVLERHGEILASCESYSMPTLLDGKRGVAQGIASVFVEERFRGNQYARALLQVLLHTFRAEHAQASLLYSEVGTKLYSELGYVARPMQARQWTPAAGEIAEVATPFSRAESERALGEFLLEESAARRFRVVLYHPQLEWHRERSAFYHRVLAPRRLDPSTLAGATRGDAWIAWAGDYRLDRLMVLAAKPGTPEQSAALVEALRRAAGALGFPIAELWESPALTLPGGQTVPRDDEVPMLCPLVPTLTPDLWQDYGRGCWV